MDASSSQIVDLVQYQSDFSSRRQADKFCRTTEALAPAPIYWPWSTNLYIFL
jgi:hypothetical protein